jgi:L-ascorbate metabolism protein UlaG (beta-lactamase superfamily)
MKITRLGWAGLQLDAAGETAIVDLLQDASPMEKFMGPPHTALPAPTSRPGSASLALVTHLHDDHTDPAAIAAALAPGGILLRPAVAEGEFLETAAVAPNEVRLAELGIDQRIVAPWDTVQAGPFTVTAIPAVDGFGDPQVGYVIEAGGTRVLHHGDTLFHGSWWHVRMRLGAPDVAFLPTNGPLVSLPHRRPGSPVEAVMGPREAAAAAAILQAGLAIPIHYDTIHHPPVYAQTEDPAGAFLREAAALGVDARIVEPGQVAYEGARAAA